MRTLILLLALAGCAASPPGTSATANQTPPPGPPDAPGLDAYRVALEAQEAQFRVPGTVTAQLGEEVRLGGVRVRPLEIVENSRCPIDVECVWAGRIRVKVAVSGAGEPVMEPDQPVALPGGRSLRLTAVAPPNWANPPAGVDPRAPMRFGFRLSGAE